MATTVDILSGGGLRLGLGAGWHDEEHAAYGFEYPDIDTRIQWLEETIQWSSNGCSSTTNRPFTATTSPSRTRSTNRNP